MIFDLVPVAAQSSGVSLVEIEPKSSCSSCMELDGDEGESTSDTTQEKQCAQPVCVSAHLENY